MVPVAVGGGDLGGGEERKGEGVGGETGQEASRGQPQTRKGLQMKGLREDGSRWEEGRPWVDQTVT